MLRRVYLFFLSLLLSFSLSLSLVCSYTSFALSLRFLSNTYLLTLFIIVYCSFAQACCQMDSTEANIFHIVHKQQFEIKHINHSINFTNTTHEQNEKNHHNFWLLDFLRPQFVNLVIYPNRCKSDVSLRVSHDVDL